jgi:hypothetical protein
MSIYTTYPFVVTSESANIERVDTGLTAVGVTLDGLTTNIFSDAATLGGVPDDTEWFEASVTLPANVAWFSVEGSAATDITNRWQYDFCRVDAADGSVHSIQPVRMTHHYTDASQTEFYGPRMSFTVTGESVNQIEDDLGGPLVVRVRMSLQNIATSAGDTGGVGEVNRLEVRAEVAPTRVADWVKHGAAWAPGIDIHPYRNGTGVDWHQARGLHVTLTDNAAGGKVESHMHPPIGGVLRYRPNGILYPNTTYEHEALALFGRYAQMSLEHAEDNTLTLTGAGLTTPNPETLTVADSGAYGVQLDYPATDSSIERSADGQTTWQPVVTGNWDSAAIVAYVDRPPLNTVINYRAWHGLQVGDGEGGYDATTGEADDGGLGWDSGSIVDFLVSADQSILATGWVLNAGTEELVIPVGDVRVMNSSTAEAVLRIDGSTVVIPGVITSPMYSVGLTLISTDVALTIGKILAEDQILLRGPHGERAWVQPVGDISTTQIPAVETGVDWGALGSLAQTAWVGQMLIQFTEDSRWDY